jgi:molecular chaperone GrpE
MGAKEKVQQVQETEELTQTETESPPSAEAAPEAATADGKDGENVEPTPDDAGTAPKSGSGLEERLKATEQENRDTQDRLLRLAAEFDNFKKRTAREKEDLRKFAAEALLKELLSVVDNLERAVESSNGNHQAKSVVEGVQMTLDELMKILERFKVEQLESMHQPFDPTFHQAVAQQPSESHPDNTVIEEFQKGYTLHGRLLRPAMVVVSKAPASPGGQSD